MRKCFAHENTVYYDYVINNKKQLQHKGLFLGSEHNIDEKYDPETINTFSLYAHHVLTVVEWSGSNSGESVSYTLSDRLN